MVPGSRKYHRTQLTAQRVLEVIDRQLEEEREASDLARTQRLHFVEGGRILDSSAMTVNWGLYLTYSYGQRV